MATIGYFDPDNVASPIIEKLYLPLSNLHWKAQDQPLKSINQLSLNFVKDSIKPSGSQHTGNIIKQNDQFYHNLILQSNNNRVPYVVIFFAKLGTIDEYKSKIRPIIRSWIAENVDKRVIEVEWMIVFIGDEVKPTSVLSKTNLLAKLKTDFNDENTSHCIQIFDHYATTAEYNQSWGILLSMLKEKVLGSFTRRLELYQSQIALLEERPVMNPTFKIILECLNMKVFYDMTLFEDSLSECDKLLSTFNNLKQEDSNGFPTAVEEFALESFWENLVFGNDIDFGKLVLDGKMDKFQFYGFLFRWLVSCLKALASNDNSLTFKTMYAMDLLSRTKLFITSVSGLWPDSSSIPPKVYQFFYLLVDEILSDPLIVECVDLNLNNPEVGKFADIVEVIGELKMTQKEQLLTLGELRDFKIEGIMTELNLNEEAPKEFEIFYEPLKIILSSQEEFTNEYVSVLQSIIDEFSLANIRPRTVGILSTEIALIDYHRGEYSSARDILSSSFDYFEDDGWDYIRTSLLRVYLECLENTEDNDNETVLKTCLALLSTKTCDLKEAANLCLKITELSKEESLSYPLKNLFDVTIDNLWRCCGVNSYCIQGNLESMSNAIFEVTKITLNLEDGEGNRLTLTSGNTVLDNGSNTFTLKTNDVICGHFKLKTFQMVLNKLTFTLDISERNTIIVPKALQDEYNNLTTRLSVPLDRNLDESSISLSIENGSSNIEDIEIQFHYATPDSKFQLMDDKLYCKNQAGEGKEVTTSNVKDNFFHFKFTSHLTAEESLELILPYTIDYKDLEPHILKFEYRLSYSQDGEKYAYVSKEDVDTSLSVAVTVQDIFESSDLFTSFSIGSSDSKIPIRVLDVDLSPTVETGSNYLVHSPPKMTSSVVAFSGQPVKLFYKVQRLGKAVDNEALALSIKYRDLKDECLFIVTEEFKNFLQERGSKDFAQEMSKNFAKALNFKLSFYCFQGFVKIENLDTDILSTFGGEKDIVNEFLQVFIKDDGFRPNQSYDFDLLLKTLRISVPMPTISVIHEVKLDFERFPNYVVGSPINVALHLKSTTSWSGNQPTKGSTIEVLASSAIPSLAPPTPASSRPTSPGLEPISNFSNGDGQYWEKSALSALSSTSTIDLSLQETKSKTKKKKKVSFQSTEKEYSSFQLELQTFDNWLISGNKRFKFELLPNGAHDYEIDPLSLVLIPLKVGRIALPKIEIKSIEHGEVSDDGTGIEINYKNSSETLVIVSEVDKISFDL